MKPIPVPDQHSAVYWHAAADSILALPRCGSCGRFTFPPDGVCATCFSPLPPEAFEAVSGDGLVRTWTVMRDAFLPGFRDDVPWTLVDVELLVQPGLRMIGRLVDGVDAEIRLGDSVHVVFDEIASGVRVPAFALGHAR